MATMNKKTRIFKIQPVNLNHFTHNCGCRHHMGLAHGPCSCLPSDYEYPLVELCEIKYLPEDTGALDNRKLKTFFQASDRIKFDDLVSYAWKNEWKCKFQKPLELRENKQILLTTGSSYFGQWNDLGMNGFGSYLMPHGVMYTGNMENDQFHGHGLLTYPNGLKFDCIFDRGKMIRWNIYFPDGLKYEIPWNYCTMPDRRYYDEFKSFAAPARLRDIPDRCYEIGDVFFDPNKMIVFGNQKTVKPLMVPTQRHIDWIKANCRRAWDEPTGYRPDLYKQFVTGAESVLDETRQDFHDNFESLHEYNYKPYIKFLVKQNQSTDSIFFDFVKDKYEGILSETVDDTISPSDDKRFERKINQQKYTTIKKIVSFIDKYKRKKVISASFDEITKYKETIPDISLVKKSKSDHDVYKNKGWKTQKKTPSYTSFLRHLKMKQKEGFTGLFSTPNLSREGSENFAEQVSKVTQTILDELKISESEEKLLNEEFLETSNEEEIEIKLFHQELDIKKEPHSILKRNERRFMKSTGTVRISAAGPKLY